MGRFLNDIHKYKRPFISNKEKTRMKIHATLFGVVNVLEWSFGESSIFGINWIDAWRLAHSRLAIYIGTMKWIYGVGWDIYQRMRSGKVRIATIDKALTGEQGSRSKYMEDPSHKPKYYVSHIYASGWINWDKYLAHRINAVKMGRKYTWEKGTESVDHFPL